MPAIKSSLGPSSNSTSSTASKADLLLDEAKLAAAVGNEQGEVFALQWLSKVEIALNQIEDGEILEIQSGLEKSLLKLICPLDLNAPIDPSPAAIQKANSASSTTPKVGRPSRHLIARCFVTLFSRGESRSLYDVMQALIQIAGEETKGRVLPEKEARAAALYVAGELFQSAGHNVMSQFVALLTLCQRLFKNSALPVLTRCHALLCLSKVLKSGAKSLGDQSAKDLIKPLRQGLSDRAGAVARGCADCLLVILEDTDYLSSRTEIESILSICFKTLDTADFVTMKAVSRLSSSLLAATQKENVVQPAAPTKKKSKKKREGQDDSSDEEAGPSTPHTAGLDGTSRSIMSPKVMLDQLSSAILRPSTTQRGRGALLDVYASLLEKLGSSWVQTHYNILIANLLDEIPNHARGSSSRADVLSIRNGVATVLRMVVGERMLDESAQVGAIQEICDTFLKKWPVLMPGQQPPTKYTLVLAFNESAGLLAQLGSVPPQVLEALQQPLLRCLAHPSHSVQISAAWCLRQMCSISPSNLSSLLKTVLDELKRDIASLESSGDRGGLELSKRATGRARGLAALVSVINHRPLYISFDISSQVLDLAFQLLKRSAEHSLAISAIEIQVSWTLIGALMSLGPNFVRDHLNQLLNMWRSALPKTGDVNVTRSDAEWSFLLHVRECTLGSILSFLTHNGNTLVTLDTARRLIALLSNSLSFVNAFNVHHPSLSQEQVQGTERSQLSLLDREQMVRRRVLQCFVKLSSNPALEALQESLVTAAIQTFAEPDRYIGSAAQAAISASSGNFTNVWQLTDGYAYGVTSLMNENECQILTESISQHVKRPDLLNRDAIESELDFLQRRAIIGAGEHDPIILYTAPFDTKEYALPVPPPTAAVDAGIELFASLIPYQKRDIQIAAFEKLLSYSRSTRLEKNPGRRMAIQANICTAILGTLRMAMHSTNQRTPGGFNNDRLTTAIRTLLLDNLIQGDLALRSSASEAFGRLAAISGSQAMSGQVQMLVDQVVSNRDPDARAGCAMAFGAIYNEVGGLAAGPLTKTVVDILMSLANDPHPTVHFTALDALRMVVDAASLSYSSYVTSTLGMLVKLYMLSTHEPEGGSAGSVNLRADLPANQAICRVVNSLIGVLGPDLQEASKVRTLVLILIKELSLETDEGVVVEGTKAMQHFTLFAPQNIDLIAWMQSLQLHLKSKNRPLKVAAINAFYQLIQRDAVLVSKACGNQLVEQFFGLLDGDAETDEIKQVLRNWLRQTADMSPNGWIDLCQRVSRSAGSSSANTGESNAKKAQPGGIGVLQDEEAATIDLGDDANSRGQANQQSRWRTQLFALQCLHDVFSTVRRAGKLEHFDTPRVPGQLSNRVGDLIRMAFTASTALNMEIRLEGLTILRDVIENFKAAKDPEFEEALLLEQHQAPIAAALTPAFLGDSTPEVLARAVQVCAVFVGSGVVREVEKLGRILKLLTRALDNCLQSDMSSMGDVKNLSINAAAMLKIAVFAAWGQLQVASAKQSYLVKVVRPQLAQLAPMWVRCLAEYANLRADPEGTGMAIAPVINPVMDTPYAGLIRAILVPHHQRAWTVILNAVAVLMGQKDNNIILAMQGEEISSDEKANAEKAKREGNEPVMYFYPLYGLAFEALATGSGSSRETQGVRTTLAALRYLCNAKFAGSVLLQDDLFNELINLSYRIIMTEPATVQVRVIEMVSAFANSYGSQLQNQGLSNGANANGSSSLSEGLVPSTKLTTCLRLALFSIQNAQTRSSSQASSAEDRAAVIRAAYAAYCGMVAFYTKTQQEHLFVAGFQAYSELLRNESSDVDLVGPTLASLKEICMASMSVYGDGLSRCVHGFLSANLNTLDEMRSRAGIVAINKTKNALLATVVVVTSLPNDVAVSQAVLEQYCYLLDQKLRPKTIDSSSLPIASTAINCLKTILLVASRRNENVNGSNGMALHSAIAFCIGQTLTSLVTMLVNAYHDRAEFIGKNSEEDEVNMNARVRVLEDAMKTLTGYAGTVQDEEHRTRFIGIILPVLSLFLQHEQESERMKQLETLAAHQILALARQYSNAFRSVVAILPVEERTRVEQGVRTAVGMTNDQANQRQTGTDLSARNEAKKIELRSFG